MKVLVATPLYPPESGGPATYVAELESGLPLRGTEVVIVKFSDVRHLPTLIRHVAYGMRVFFAAEDVDLIYALDSISVGVPALFAARLRGKPLAVKIVGDFAWEQGMQKYGVTSPLEVFVREKNVALPLRFFRFLQKEVALSAQCVIVPSTFLKGIVEAWGVESAKIEVIYNAVKLPAVGQVVEALRALPRPLVVSVGRLVPWKGNRELLDAVRIVRQKGKKLSVAIIGDGPERQALEARAKDALGSDYAFTGALGHADAFAAMQYADMYVLDSLYEGLSHTLVEARMAGAAIVASNRGGNPEVIEHEVSGLLVPAEDPQKLADALERLLDEGELRARLKTNAKDMSGRFDVDSMLENIAERLRAIV